MIFNSIDFAIFLPVVFLLYWLGTNKNPGRQNFLIVLASYLFYGWWDARFLFLMLFSTVVDFSIGVALKSEDHQLKRKILLYISIIVNLGLLGFFKYYNFFLENFVSAFTFFGFEINGNSLNIILPVGISFYTFQTLSYTIDVYRKKIEPTHNFIVFSAFVSFFPQLVAGPIERATHLLPQFYKKRHFNYPQAVNGMRQILWGLFKKIVIADNCAEYANQIFNNSEVYSGSTLALGALFFTIQIYCDFSGYSDIAIGTSRLFGFDLKRNFHFPYFSRDIAEFWRRWHISLSTWFRDYLYIPLGGSKGGKWMKIRNTFIIFIVSGFWHGASWTFIAWGALNALYFLPLLLAKRNRKNLDSVAMGRLIPSVKEFLSISLTFGMTVFAWIFFRSRDMEQAYSIIKNIFSISFLTVPQFSGVSYAMIILILAFLFFITEWVGREGDYAISNIDLRWSRPYRWAFYFVIVALMFVFEGNEQEFIYFQF